MEYITKAKELRDQWFIFAKDRRYEKHIEEHVLRAMNELLDLNMELAHYMTITFAVSVSWKHRKERHKEDLLPYSQSKAVRDKVDELQRSVIYSMHRFLLTQSFVYTSYTIYVNVRAMLLMWRKSRLSASRKYPQWSYDVRQELLESGLEKMQAR